MAVSLTGRLAAFPGRLRTGAGRLARSTWAHVRGVSVWGWAMAAVVAAYAWYFTWLSLDLHHGLGTSTFDYGLYDQGVWLLSRFKAPFVTLMGRNLFGDHTSFILVFLVPLYWVMPGAGVLLGTQSLAAALGAVPVYLLARARLGSGAVAVLLGSLFLLHPALQWTNLEDFHPDTYLVPLVGFAVWAALERRWRTYAVCVALALLVKEDVALVTVPLGLWVAWRRDRTIGLVTVGASIAWGLFAMLAVIGGLSGRLVPNAWRIPFGGVRGLVAETLARPGNVIDYLRSDGRPFYLWQMGAPFAWVFARAPEVAAISALVVATNVLSNFGYQHRIDFHYSAVALPALALGTVAALAGTTGRRRRTAVAAVAAAALWSAYLWGPLPPARTPVAYWAPDHPVAVSARELIAEVPDGAVVSAHWAVTPHLARREQIYSWPNPFARSMYGTDISLEGSPLPAADDVAYVLLRLPLQGDDMAVWSGIADRFSLVRANTDWALFARTGG
ncbi:MAG: DUF2079 domain-containing protein [Actinobacteria bacterium]|nr:DUF2079 domain-containing protein [Actinomycetota bacterium]